MSPSARPRSPHFPPSLPRASTRRATTCTSLSIRNSLTSKHVTPKPSNSAMIFHRLCIGTCSGGKAAVPRAGEAYGARARDPSRKFATPELGKFPGALSMAWTCIDLARAVTFASASWPPVHSGCSTTDPPLVCMRSNSPPVPKVPRKASHELEPPPRSGIPERTLPPDEDASTSRFTAGSTFT
jgi:hypothetical protein